MKPAQAGDDLAGRYRLRGIVGRGGMGIVWLASDEYLDREVAVKEAVRPPGLDERDWSATRQRALREARTAARLTHYNIVSVYDVIEHDGRPWIVMQYVPYPSLSDVIRECGPLPASQAAQAGLQVLAALRAAHAAGVMHRDVKPANVLLGPDGRVVLADFGLAVLDTGPGMTVSGQVVGSPAYMAPERAHGERATPAADLWSLGATLYAAAEGRAPFQRASTVAVLTAVVTEDPDPPVQAGPLWPVISGLMRRDPLARLSADQADMMLRKVSQQPATATALMPSTAARDRGRPTGEAVAAETRQFSTAAPARGPLAAAALPPGEPQPAGAWPAGAAPRQPSSRNDRPLGRTAAWLAGAAAAVVTAAAIALIALLITDNPGGQQAKQPPRPAASTSGVRTSPSPSVTPSPNASAAHRSVTPAQPKPNRTPPGHSKHHKHGKHGKHRQHGNADGGGNSQ